MTASTVSTDAVTMCRVPHLRRKRIEFYRRNYIEGLFLSSGVLQNPNYTMELLYQTLCLLRTKYRFEGYIHVKAIPGASPVLIEKTGYLADMMSVNLELPTAEGLKKLAPHKSRRTILAPMRQIQTMRQENQYDLTVYRRSSRFVPAGQSTQMICRSFRLPSLSIRSFRLRESFIRRLFR